MRLRFVFLLYIRYMSVKNPKRYVCVCVCVHVCVCERKRVRDRKKEKEREREERQMRWKKLLVMWMVSHGVINYRDV